MASADATDALGEEKTLIVLAAPSINDNYYRAVFNQIVDYMVNFVHLVHGNDEVIILVDAKTLPYFNGKVGDGVLVQADIEDIWVRDFAPVLPFQQIKFKYLPNYLSRSDTNTVNNSFEKWLTKNGLSYKTKCSIILDGGNFVDNPTGSRVIITDRILSDNAPLTKAEAKEQLQHVLGVQHIAIIPESDDDTTGHADGMVMWANDNKILLQELPETQRQAIIDELQTSFPGVEIVEVPDYYQHATWKGFTSACNIFVNSLVTDQYIYMPTFNGPHDQSMCELIQSHTSKKVIPVPAEKVCFMGGSVRCLTWQVKGQLKRSILELARSKE